MKPKMGIGSQTSVVAKQQQEEEKDRISFLSDDLLCQILSYLESCDAVQTRVLCKRWEHLWTTLHALNIISHGRPYSFDFLTFATNFLMNRNPQFFLSTIEIHCNPFSSDKYRGDPRNFKILEYALTHNVEHLRICEVHSMPSTVNSASIKTLHLTFCAEFNIMDWNMPNLTSLYLEHVRFGDRISGFQHLKELTLAGYFHIYPTYQGPEIFTINCPNLESLTLCPDCLPQAKFTVSAPKLLYFEFRSGHVPGFSAGDGFPCIKEVYFHIQIDSDEWELFYNEDRKKLLMQNSIDMWNAVKGTPLLKLANGTIQVLGKIPHFSEYQPSPFGNLKFLSLRGLYGKPTMSTKHVINYFRQNSPHAKIVKGNIGRMPKSANIRGSY